MPYLELPRFTFSGRFEADISTVNNNAVNFDAATFLPEYDAPGVLVVDPQGNPIGMTNGWFYTARSTEVNSTSTTG